MNTQPLQTTLEGKNLFRNQLIPQRNLWIIEQIKEAFKRSGQYNAEADIVNLVATDFKEDIEQKLFHYSMDEIESILKLGARGELGDTGAISSRLVAGWVRAYKNDYRRKLTRLNKPERILLNESKEPKRLTDQQLNEYVSEMKAQYETDGTLYAATFDILLKYNRINVPIETRKEIKHKAKANVLTEMENKVTSGLISIQDYNVSKDSGHDSRIKEECKRLAVEWYFNETIENT